MVTILTEYWNIYNIIVYTYNYLYEMQFNGGK